MIGVFGYLKTSNEDIWENKDTHKQYKPTKVTAGYNSKDAIVLVDIESGEIISVLLTEFREKYMLVKASLKASKHFFI